MVTTFCVWRGLYAFATNSPSEMPKYFAYEKVLVTSHQEHKILQTRRTNAISLSHTAKSSSFEHHSEMVLTTVTAELNATIMDKIEKVT